MKVEKIDHVCMFVSDLEKARQFFAELFEIEFDELGTLEEQDARSVISPLGLEIIEPLTQDGDLAKTLKKRGEGAVLISFKTPSLDRAMAEMEDRGIRLIGRLEKGLVRAAMYHPKDTFGVMIELIEYKEEHDVITAARK